MTSGLRVNVARDFVGVWEFRRLAESGGLGDFGVHPLVDRIQHRRIDTAGLDQVGAKAVDRITGFPLFLLAFRLVALWVAFEVTTHAIRLAFDEGRTAATPRTCDRRF